MDGIKEELPEEIYFEGRAGSKLGYCPKCRKWQTYIEHEPMVGETLHCHGCRKPVNKCTC